MISSSLVAKVLISAMSIGALTGGGYGFFSAINNKNTKSLNLKPNITSEKKIIQLASDKEATKEEKIVEVKKEAPLLVENKETENVISSLAPTQEIKDKESIEKDLKENKEISKEQLTSYESQVEKNHEFSADIESTQQEIQLTEEELQKQYEAEMESKDILLETVWMRRVVNTVPNKSCFLLVKNKQNEIQLPDMGEDEDEEKEEKMEDSCDNDEETTSWATNKRLDTKEGDGFWMRGEKEWVKKMFNKNWDSLIKDSVYNKNKEEKVNLESLEIKDKLSDTFCKVIDKNEGKRIEVSCVYKDSDPKSTRR